METAKFIGTNITKYIKNMNNVKSEWGEHVKSILSTNLLLGPPIGTGHGFPLWPPSAIFRKAPFRNMKFLPKDEASSGR